MTIKEAFEALSNACATGMKNPFFVMRRLKENFADVADKVDGGGGSTVEVEAELTEGTKIATITVDGDDTDIYAPASGGVNYSTTEQVIGTWVDGKPLYERAFLEATFSATANTWYKTTISKGSMKYLIDVFVVFENATTPSVHKGMSGGFVDDYLAINSFRNVETDAGTTCYVVAQYTKTTD